MSSEDFAGQVLPLGHPSLSFVPHLHSFPGTAGDVPSIPASRSGAGPSTLNPHRGSRAPTRDFGVGARTELGSLSLPFPEVTSRFTNFETVLLAGSLLRGGSSSGQGRPVIPAQESGRADPRVAGGTVHDAKRRPPPVVTTPAAAAAAAATARIPALARVTPLLLFQHLGPEGETLFKFAASTFPGAQNWGSGNALRPVS